MADAHSGAAPALVHPHCPGQANAQTGRKYPSFHICRPNTLLHLTFLASNQPDLHLPRLSLHLTKMEAATRDASQAALPQHAQAAFLTRVGNRNLPTAASFSLRYNGIGHSEGALVSSSTYVLACSVLGILCGAFSAIHDLAHPTFTLASGLLLASNILFFHYAWRRRRTESATVRQAEAAMAGWEARNPRPH